jgi:hypothetical protein
MPQAAHSPRACAEADLTARLRAGGQAPVPRSAERWPPTMTAWRSHSLTACSPLSGRQGERK